MSEENSEDMIGTSVGRNSITKEHAVMVEIRTNGILSSARMTSEVARKLAADLIEQADISDLPDDDFVAFMARQKTGGVH